MYPASGIRVLAASSASKQHHVLVHDNRINALFGHGRKRVIELFGSTRLEFL
jgi:hypothetical protein